MRRADPAPPPGPTDAEVSSDEPASLRADLHDAIGWISLGVATLAASIAMDRLESQHINPLTVPGLLPGLLGIGMIVLGAAMGLRSWWRGALTQTIPPATADQREQRRRVILAAGLCCGYGVVLIGHGLPFWLASTIYVTTSILVFQRISRDPVERRLNARAAGKALLIGVLSSVTTWLVFERVFLVRLP